MPYAEISARLGIPVGSIGPTRRRCLDKLRRHPAIAGLSAAELRSSPQDRGTGLAVCTMTWRPSLIAAATNAGSTSVWAKKLFAGTTISVSLELPVIATVTATAATTGGYSDFHPVTAGGRITACFIGRALNP